MARSAARTSDYIVLFDGQSLNYAPQQPLGGENDYPHQMMPTYFPNVPWKQTAASGISWTVLGPTAFRRTHPYLKASATPILVACGGTSDVLDGDDGTVVYSDMWAYTDACRAVNAGLIVIGCTITPSNGITGSFETERLEANILINANLAGKFDYVVDLSAGVPLNGTNYMDGLHFSTAGATLAAELIRDPLEAIIPAHLR